MQENPATPIGEMVASAPPATKASASPNLMMRQASPMQLFEVAHAVTIDMFGPLRPYSMEIRPLAMLLIIMAMVNGESFEGPRSKSFLASSSMVRSPPIPLPTITPNRSRSTV